MKGLEFLFALIGVAIALILLVNAVKPPEAIRDPKPTSEKHAHFQAVATAACRCAHKPDADETACWSDYRELTKDMGGQVGSTLAAQDSITSECFGDFESPDRFCVTLEATGRRACTWSDAAAGRVWPSTPAPAPIP